MLSQGSQCPSLQGTVLKLLHWKTTLVTRITAHHVRITTVKVTVVIMTPSALNLITVALNCARLLTPFYKSRLKIVFRSAKNLRVNTSLHSPISPMQFPIFPIKFRSVLIRA